MEQWSGEEQYQRREEEELSAVPETTVLLPCNDCYGHSEVPREEADFIWGKNVLMCLSAQYYSLSEIIGL